VPERDVVPVREGQWRRLISPLAVQTLGPHQAIANLASLAVVGVIAELWTGRRLWGATAVAGTVAGRWVAHAQGQLGGGDSIVVCGLAGGVAGDSRPGQANGIPLSASRRPSDTICEALDRSLADVN
jgi:hypothetical protein